MIPGMNPRDMQKVMKRMGVKQEEINASEVVIKCSDKELVISNPQVLKVNMMGQETFQISGEISERTSLNEEDIKTVMEQAGVSREEALKALEESGGDIAEAIISLKE
tara:strand:- start:97 stop:420 length:324 start_codon:yes stop_codon:yes gene_type:complete